MPVYSISRFSCPGRVRLRSVDCGCGSRLNRHGLVVNPHGFDCDERGLRIALSGIDRDHALDRWKPESAVTRFPACRTGAVAFTAEHAIGHTICNRGHRLEAAVGEIIQFAQADAKDAAIAAHPQISAVILRIGQNLERAVVKEAVPDGDGDEPAIFEAAQAAAVRADPEAPRAVCEKRQHLIAGQPVFGCPGGEVLCFSLEAADAAVDGANPQLAFPAFVQRGGVVV